MSFVRQYQRRGTGWTNSREQKHEDNDQREGGTMSNLAWESKRESSGDDEKG